MQLVAHGYPGERADRNLPIIGRTQPQPRFGFQVSVKRDRGPADEFELFLQRSPGTAVGAGGPDIIVLLESA